MLSRIHGPAVAILVALMLFVSHQQPACAIESDDLTQTLLAATDTAERHALMEEHSEFITDKYINALIDSAYPAFFGGNPDLAFQIMDLAVELSDFTQDDREKAWSLFNRGKYYYYASNFEAALEQYDLSIQISKRIGYELGEANCYKSQGDVFFHAGDNQAALDKYDQALPIFKKVKDALGEANCYKSQGDVLFYTGDNQAALEKFELALPLYNEAQSSLGEANCYRSQGDVYFYTGDNQAALEKYELAIPIYKKTQSSLGEANCYRSQGDVFLRIGDYQAAFEKFELALPLYKKTQSPLGEANCYKGQGDVLFYAGDYQPSLEKYELALPLYIDAQDPQGVANCYSRQGDVFFRTGDDQAALDKFELALQLYKKMQEPMGEANCFQGQGDVLLRTGDYRAALEKYELALQLFARINAVHSLMWNYYNMGRAQRALGRTDAALESFSSSISQGEFLVTRAGSEKMQRGAMEQQSDIYEETIDLLLELGRDAEALEVLEKMRGAVLRNMLEQGRVDPLARAPEHVRTEAARIRADMAAAMGELSMEMQQPGFGDPDRIAELKDRHAQAARQLDALMSQAAAAYSGVAAAGAGVPALNVQALQEKLPPGTLLIEYFLGKNRTAVFALSRDHFAKKALPCDAEKIARLAKTFSLTNKNSNAGTNALYKCLLAPVEQELQDATLVLASPDKEVNYLPLDALRPKRGDYLFGPDRPLVNVLSGTMYVEDSKRAAAAARDFSKETVLALGGADFGGGADGDGFEGDARNSLAELPGTIPEVERIGELFGDSALVLLEDDATEANAIKNITGRGVIHFSTHGLLNLNDPMSSALALSEIGMRVRGNAPPEDGFLTAREIMTDQRIQLEGGLAVLSACETGKGELSRSEGVIGLTRAFAAAGARAEIVSLWSVADESTSMLFQFFYKHLKTGESPAAALAAAKQDIRKYMSEGDDEPPWAAPFYWAPFIYVGAP